VALKVQIRLAEQIARSNGAGPVADLLADVAVDAEVAVDEIRTLARGIYPPLLGSDGLAAALRSQAVKLPVPVGLAFGALGRYPKDVESAVYFAVLEAITNALKHAAPSRLEVALDERDGRLEVVVSDDGAGFDADRSDGGGGLTGIRDRVEAVGGELTVASSPGEGTTLTAVLPVERAVGGAGNDATAGGQPEAVASQV